MHFQIRQDSTFKRAKVNNYIDNQRSNFVWRIDLLKKSIACRQIYERKHCFFSESRCPGFPVCQRGNQGARRHACNLSANALLFRFKIQRIIFSDISLKKNLFPFRIRISVFKIQKYSNLIFPCLTLFNFLN